MKKFLLLVLSLALPISVLPWVRPAQGVPAPNRTPLKGVNVIKASRPGVIDVHVPRTVTWDPFRVNERGADVRLSGRGRYVGALITKRQGRFTDPIALISRFGGCMGRGCAPTNDAVWDFDGGGKLEPGDYQVYVITDGSSVRITLRVNELSGRSVLRPDRPVETKVKSPQPIFHHGQSHYFSSGVTLRQERQAFYNSIVWARTRPLGAETSWCGYPGKQPRERSEAFTPQYCAMNDNQSSEPSVFPPWPSESIRYYHIDGSYGLDRGLMSVGHWFVSQAPIERAGSAHVYLEYE